MFDEKYFSKLLVFQEPSKQITFDLIMEGVNKRVRFRRVKNCVLSLSVVFALAIGLLLFNNTNLKHNVTSESFANGVQRKYEYLVTESGFIGHLETDAVFWGENNFAVGNF